MYSKPTKRQQSVFDFLKNFLGENGYPPSLREICVHFGIRSPKNAKKHLEALERKGLIKRSANISRAIEILGTSSGKTISVPIAGRVKAGVPHLAVEDIEGYVRLDSRFFRCKGAFLLRAEGESMVGAGIEDGDYLLIRPQGDADNGDIVVAMLDDEATVKRFVRKRGVVILKPENPEMKHIEVRDGGREISIIGKVVSIIKHI